MTPPILYPIGIQTFSEIAKRKLMYVDKTEYVYHLTHDGGKYFFLIRPRRFGKSLLVSTLQSYFEGKRDLFKGLGIDQLESERAEYPVLHFDISGGKHLDKEELENYLLFILRENEEKYGIANDSPNTNIRQNNLILELYKKTGRQAVVLIDEYDASLLDVVHEETMLEVLRNVMLNFYSPLKKCEPYLRFVFLTDITKFSQMSIFSELNNITDISMDNEYAGICGITKEELLTQMTPDINMPAETQGLSHSAYDSYILGLPNKEVRIGLTKALIPYYVTPDTLAANNTVRNMARAIDKQDITMALVHLQTFLGTIPYCDNTDYDGHYQQMMFVIFTLLSAYMADVEVHTPRGRVDMVLRTATHLYLFELKLNKSADTAISQIDLKENPKHFATCQWSRWASTSTPIPTTSPTGE